MVPPAANRRIGGRRGGEALLTWLAELDKGLFTLTPDREVTAEAVALSTKLKHPLADCL